MSLKSFTSSAARHVRTMSGLLTVLLIATMSAGNAYAQTETTYTGIVDDATGAFVALTPIGTPVGGPIVVSDAALAAGSIGIADIVSIAVNVGGFCFSNTGSETDCPGGGSLVPVTSIDAAAITGTGGTLGGNFAVTAFSPTFNVSIPILFDLSAGTFSADGGALGTVAGTGLLVAPGGNAPEITVSPTSIDFGTVAQNATVTTQDVTITNDGTGDLSITNISLPGTTVTDSDNCPATLASMASCTITLSLNTTSIASVSETLTITSDDADEMTVDVTVTAEIVAPAALTSGTTAMMPLMIDSVAVGGTTTGTVSIDNTGGLATLLGAATAPGAPFSLTANDNCSGTTLAPADPPCTIEVQFAPTASGMFDSSFSIAGDGGAISTTVFVASSTLDPSATPSADPLMIADTMVNSTSTGTLTITNDGDADLDIASITGLDAPFSVTAEDCTTASVVPMDTCDITVQFAPVVEMDNQSDTLIIASNDPSSPLNVSVNANGTEELFPNIMLSTNTVNFAAPVLIGDSNTQTGAVTVTNLGMVDLTIASIDIAPMTDFSQANDCGGTLAPMGTCTIDLTLAPASAGPLAATLTINSDDPDTPAATVAVSGTGETPAPNIVLSTMLLDLGVVTVTESKMATVTISNTGSTNLIISSVTIPAGDYSQTNDCTVAQVVPMDSCTVTVTFAPSVVATITDTLTVVSNDADAMMSTVSLTGRGVLVPEGNVSSTLTELNLGTGLFGETISGSVPITNNGNADLTITSIGVSGTDAGEFSAAQDCLGVLAEGDTCLVAIDFSPIAPAGGKTASLDVGSDDLDTPNFVVGLLGTSEMPLPEAGFSPMAIAFADTVVGQTATETLTVSNTGNGVLTVTNVALDGMGTAFMVTAETCTATPVAVSGSCTVTVTFMPDAEASFSDTLSFDSDDPTTPMAAIAVSGDGIPQPAADISVDVMSLAFGTATFGSSEMLTVTVTNAGNADLTISGATIPAGEFSATTMCGVLTPAASCTVEVTYTPTIAGDVMDTLTIASDDADTPALTIPLTGFGMAPAPEFDPSATALTFGPVAAGTMETMDLVITNNGMADLTISSVTLSGTDQALFTETNDCATVAMSATCTVSVTYAPLVAGNATADLTIVSNDADEGTAVIALSGSATPEPMSMISVPATLDIGDVAAGQTGNGTITVTNNGSADLVITDISVGGTNAADFAQSNNCTTVAAGNTCDIDIVFTPTLPGAATADVVIASNDAATPSATVTVTASGTVPVAMLSSMALDLGSVSIGQSGSATVTVTNAGNTDLVVSGAVLGGAGAASFALTNNCGTVAAGASCTIDATFTPTATGASMATIEITTNDPAAATATVTLSATGAPMEEVVVAVSSEGGGVGSFGLLELLLLALFIGVVRRSGMSWEGTRASARAVWLPLAIAAGLVVSAPQVLADDHDSTSDYWYIGASFGNSDGQADQGAITSGIEAGGVTVTSLNIDDTDSGFKVYGGFQATEVLAIEVGYVDLGEAGIDVQLGDVTLEQLPLISRNVSGNLSLLGNGLFGALVAKQAVTDNVSVFARAGLVSWEVDTAIGGGTSSGSLNIVETESGTDFMFGIGVEAAFGASKRFAIRGEWERYEIGGQDAEFLSLGGVFRF